MLHDTLIIPVRNLCSILLCVILSVSGLNIDVARDMQIRYFVRAGSFIKLSLPPWCGICSHGVRWILYFATAKYYFVAFSYG